MRRLTCMVLASSLLGFGLALPAAAENAARVSFEAFAVTWMGKLEKGARRTHGGNGYKGFTEPTLEMRPTGNPTIPYVGTLRYREQVYSCASGRSQNCQLTAETPVREIFRYQGGRWVY